MSATYTVALRDPNGNDIEIWDDFISLDYGRSVNEAGRLTLKMPVREGINPRVIRRDYHILVYRNPDNGFPYLDMRTWWIIDDVVWDTWKNELTIGAGDLLHLLKRRIVGYTPQTSYADKTFVQHGIDSGTFTGFFLKADDMMKEYVYENLGAGCLDTDRIISALSIEADKGEGPNVEQQAAWRPILQVCQDIANQSAGLGTDLYFDIVPIGDKNFEFRTYTNVLNIDHSSTTANPIIFADENLANTKLRWNHIEEKTYLYVTGEGSGSGVHKKESGDSTRDYSMWGRIEGYFSIGGESIDDDYMGRKLSEKLYEARGKLVLTANVVDTPGSIYGVDYNYGDKIAASVNGYTFDSLIDSVRVSVSGGDEKITASVLGEITL